MIPDYVMHCSLCINETLKLFYLYSSILYNFISIIGPNFVVSHLLYVYKIERPFYLYKLYTLFKGLFIYKIIACQGSIAPQTFYLIENRKILLLSNILR